MCSNPMIPRERFRAMMEFRRPDRPFIWTFETRRATMDEWVKQGHPPGVRTCELLGYDRFDGIPLVTAHWPRFEQRVVEERDGHVTFYDEEGALRMEGVDAQGSGFVTRKWLRFPVENREDFLAMTARYNPEDESRRRPAFAEAVAASHTSVRPVMFTIQGFYWTLRQWMGFEGLSLAFMDRPELIDEMLEFVLDYNLRLMRAHIGKARVDVLMINEDMAYKTACMVSPAVIREKILPCWRALAEAARSLGIRGVFVDSDGHISELIPLWLEAGIDGTSPVEIAAEQDILQYAEQYPAFRFFGGLDKRCLIYEESDVEREVLRKAEKLYARGGWIPAVDHAVPANAKFENFRLMIELLKAAWPE